jgi:hypothetical protein
MTLNILQSYMMMAGSRYYRRVSNGDQTHRVTGLAMRKRVSPDFTGYWQRHSTA